MGRAGSKKMGQADMRDRVALKARCVGMQDDWMRFCFGEMCERSPACLLGFFLFLLSGWLCLLNSVDLLSCRELLNCYDSLTGSKVAG